METGKMGILEWVAIVGIAFSLIGGGLTLVIMLIKSHFSIEKRLTVLETAIPSFGDQLQATNTHLQRIEDKFDRLLEQASMYRNDRNGGE